MSGPMTRTGIAILNTRHIAVGRCENSPDCDHGQTLRAVEIEAVLGVLAGLAPVHAFLDRYGLANTSGAKHERRRAARDEAYLALSRVVPPEAVLP